MTLHPLELEIRNTFAKRDLEFFSNGWSEKVTDLENQAAALQRALATEVEDSDPSRAKRLRTMADSRVMDR